MSHKRYVPIKRLSLPEVASSTDFAETLTRIYDQGLPGFVIRNGGLQDTGDSSHRALTRRIVENMPAATQNADAVFSIRFSLPETFGGYKGIADLHHDFPHYDIKRHPIRLHLTKEGSGHVTLANSGPLHANHYLSEHRRGVSPEIDEEDLEQVGSKMLHALANPNIINPQVYTAFLNTGDHVILPLFIPLSDSHDRGGPVWHRFDTSTDHRRAIASEIAEK